MKKERLDIILVNRSLCETREKAKSTIMAGYVYVNSNREDKPGSKFSSDADIIIKGNPNPYVSRGGIKLEKAIKEFSISLIGKNAIDIGASTGGFTDCMLQNGVNSVLAIDVGYGQLAWKLRTDQRVRVMERTNIRYVNKDDIGCLVDFITVDVSFISLEKILPVMKVFLNEKGGAVCLIKPQFEAGRDQVGKNGVVRDWKVHKQVIEKVIGHCVNNEFCVEGLTYSPIKGPEGNIEYLLYLSKSDNDAIEYKTKVEKIVNEAVANLVAIKK